MTTTPAELFTPSGVRLRQRVTRDGALNWLLLPGGPGLGSESLHGLADVLDVPGSIWMVDLPGDGSNVRPREEDPFARWPQVLLEAAHALPNCVYVGHSTGGMYLLSVPELESCLAGLVLISSAPDASWRGHYFEMTKQHPLPDVERAAERYQADKTIERLRDLVLASAPWNFMPRSIEAGREALRGMPYNIAAVDWSDAHFDDTYAHRWWPHSLPTLIVSGAEDRIVVQTLWDDPKFRGPNVTRVLVPGAAHFPWVEEPEAVRVAFGELAKRIAVGSARTAASLRTPTS